MMYQMVSPIETSCEKYNHAIDDEDIKNADPVYSGLAGSAFIENQPESLDYHFFLNSYSVMVNMFPSGSNMALDILFPFSS
jgi:hypothetical protein